MTAHIVQSSIHRHLIAMRVQSERASATFRHSHLWAKALIAMILDFSTTVQQGVFVRPIQYFQSVCPLRLMKRQRGVRVPMI